MIKSIYCRYGGNCVIVITDTDYLGDGRNLFVLEIEDQGHSLASIALTNDERRELAANLLEGLE